MEERYKFEVQLDQENKTFKGVTYSYKTTVFYGKASCYGSINKQTKKVFLEETRITELKTTGGDGACIMTCFLQYAKVGNEELLEGHYTSMNNKDSSRCGQGTVFLRKVETSDFYKEPFLTQKEKPRPAPIKIKPVSPPVVKKQGPPKTTSKPLSINPRTAKPARPKQSAPQTVAPKKDENLVHMPEDSLKNMIGRTSPTVVVPQVLASRTNELVKTIITSAKKITIKIYDNGAIDNDTVSVYVDKKLVVSKARLTEQAILVNFDLDEKNDIHELVMVAENLGDIPPNTSLMVVTAGDRQYEVRITSTEQKNAVVLFKYDAKVK